MIEHVATPLAFVVPVQLSASIVKLMVAPATGVLVTESVRVAERMPGSLKSDVASATWSVVGCFGTVSVIVSLKPGWELPFSRKCTVQVRVLPGVAAGETLIPTVRGGPGGQPMGGLSLAIWKGALSCCSGLSRPLPMLRPSTAD